MVWQNEHSCLTKCDLLKPEKQNHSNTQAIVKTEEATNFSPRRVLAAIPQCQEEKKISAEFDEAGLVLERKGEGVIFETSGIHGEANGISIILYFIRD